MLEFIDRKPIDATDGLDQVALAQLAVIGELYFGEPTTPQISADGDEGTLSAVDHWRVVDGERHVYDAWFYMGDSGTIFEAGTTTNVAEIIQCGLECGDKHRRVALGAAMVAAKLLPKGDLSYKEFAAALAAAKK